MAVQLDRFHRLGDVYDTLEACEQLQHLLGRLRRQHLLGEQDWMRSGQWLSEIRFSLEEIVDAPGAVGSAWPASS